MPVRTLKDRVLAEIGYRKVVKYFPSETTPEEGDTDAFEEFVRAGLTEVGNTIPFFASEDVDVEADGTLDVSPCGRQSARRLKVESISYGGIKAPPAKVSFCLGHPTLVYGWTEEDGIVSWPSSPPYAAGTTVLVKFRVIPTEEEVVELEDFARATTCFAAATAFESIASIAEREHTIVIEGVPDVRSKSDQPLRQAAALRERAQRVLGSYVASQ